MQVGVDHGCALASLAALSRVGSFDLAAVDARHVVRVDGELVAVIERAEEQVVVLLVLQF